VVETVAGRCFQSDPDSVAVDSWSEVAIASIPGFSDPKEDQHSLVERWTICPDRGLSLMTLSSCSGVLAAFEKVRCHGRVASYHVGGLTRLPDIKDLITNCEALPEVTFGPVLKVDAYNRFGARCLLVQDVLSPSLCDFLTEMVDNSSERTQQTFQGLSLHDDFWISERVKAESKDLAELLFNRMLPAVKDLVIAVDSVDPARQSLLIDGMHLAGEDRCPEALQLGTDMAGVWRVICALQDMLLVALSGSTSMPCM